MSITKKIRTKFLSLMLVLSVVITGLIPTTAVFASEITDPGSAKSNAVLNSDGLIMDVTVPTNVLIYVDENGEVTTPDYLPIINNSVAPVFVHSLTVTPKNGWTLDPIATDYTNFKTNRKNYWLAFNGLDPSSEPIALATPINGSDSLNLVLSADVAPQRTATTALNVGEIVITIDWDAAEGAQEGNQEQEFSIDGATYTAPRTYVVNFNAPEAGLYFVAATLPNDPAPEDPYSAQIMQFVSVFTAGTQEKTVLFDAASEEMKDADIYIWRMNDEGDIIGPLKTTVREEGTGGNDEGTGDDYEHEGVIPEGYILATNADFSGTRDGEFRYIGSNPYVVVPHVIKGVPVTSYYYMFEGTDVKGVASDNPNITDMSYMFANSTSETLDLANLDTSSVDNMSGMFNFTSAKNLDLSNFDTRNVTNMSNMFYGYSDANLDLSGFDTSNVTDMSWMFAYSYFSPDFTNLVTSNVTNMAGMFESNSSTTLNLTGLDTSSVTDMSNMFKGGRATSYDFSNFDTRNVTNMSNMFNDNDATTLDLTSFDISRLTNMSYMFRYSSATTVDISSFNLAEIQPSIGAIFDYADNLTTVYVRAQEDIDYIIERSYSEIPDTINFVIK